MINKIFIIVTAISLLLAGLVESKAQGRAEGGYGHTLYPYVHEYDQLLVYKIGVDYCPATGLPDMDAEKVLEIIEQIDHITRGIPKMVYLVGWQYRGHDTGFPSFGQVNEALHRPEDTDALASLRWLMRKGPEFNTLVSLHVNFSDIYLDDNPLGPEYKEKDIIVRWSNGDYHEGYHWCDHMAYRASNFRNWNQGTFREKQIKPLFDMIPELAMSGSLHPDAWYNTSNPYYGISDEADCKAMREMTTWVRETYNVDITTEFDRRRPEHTDFVHFHPLLWHMEWDERTPPDPMKIPSYFLAGTNAKTWSSGTETVQSKFFGEMGDYEGIIRADPDGMKGLEGQFATRTLPWYFLNRRLRVSFDGNTARFSEGVSSTYPDRYTLHRKGNTLQDGRDVFMPAEWLSHKEIIAYSGQGYSTKKWSLPEKWAELQKADIYSITREGLVKKDEALRIDKTGCLTLCLEAGELVSIVPSGTDVETQKEKSSSGTAEFLGKDTESHGKWKEKYGQQGYILIGDSTSLPPTMNIRLIGGAERIWTKRSADIEALDRVDGKGKIAASRYHPLHEIIDIQCGEGESRDIALYLLDWERSGRWTIVDVIDADTRKLIDSRNLTRFGSGVYLKYRISGHIQIRLTNVHTDRYTGSEDATFSGIFIGIR